MSATADIYAHSRDFGPRDAEIDQHHARFRGSSAAFYPRLGPFGSVLGDFAEAHAGFPPENERPHALAPSTHARRTAPQALF